MGEGLPKITPAAEAFRLALVKMYGPEYSDTIYQLAAKAFAVAVAEKLFGCRAEIAFVPTSPSDAAPPSADDSGRCTKSPAPEDP